ncbi:unnamed protein product [Mucor hiemalis]
MSAERYKNLKVKELQELLQKHGIPHSGKKEELIERLVKYNEAQELATLEEEFGDLEEFDESKLDLSDIKPIDDEFSKDADIIETVPPTTSTTEAIKASDPVESSKPSSNFKFTPISFEKKTEEIATTTAAPPPAAAASPKPAASPKTESTVKPNNDAEKALERAKRFGIQLNEKAKQDIRAQRFGIPTKTPSPKPTNNNNNNKNKKGVDPEVLKKRAERFGINNKKNSGGKVPVTLDPADEEKKRKRAERFNNDPSKKQKAE